MQGAYDNLYPDYVFFFQAEDGIRDLTVTGVQTCALPICTGTTSYVNGSGTVTAPHVYADNGSYPITLALANRFGVSTTAVATAGNGRASCRERVEISVGAVALKKKKQTIVLDL